MTETDFRKAIRETLATLNPTVEAALRRELAEPIDLGPQRTAPVRGVSSLPRHPSGANRGRDPAGLRHRDRLAAGARSVSPHLCREDCYAAVLLVRDEGIVLKWSADGPRKKETIEYEYR